MYISLSDVNTVLIAGWFCLLSCAAGFLLLNQCISFLWWLWAPMKLLSVFLWTQRAVRKPEPFLFLLHSFLSFIVIKLPASPLMTSICPRFALYSLMKSSGVCHIRILSQTMKNFSCFFQSPPLPVSPAHLLFFPPFPSPLPFSSLPFLSSFLSVCPIQNFLHSHNVLSAPRWAVALLPRALVSVQMEEGEVVTLSLSSPQTAF